MRLVILLLALGLFSFSGCGPAKNKPAGKPEPEPNVPTIEPPAPEPMDQPPVTPEKSPMPTPMPTPPATPEKSGDGGAPAGTNTSVAPASPEEVTKLIDSLKKTEARDGALAELKAKGPGVVPSLISALESDASASRHHLLVALGSFGKDASAALPALKKLVESEKDPATVATAQFTIDAIEGN